MTTHTSTRYVPDHEDVYTADDDGDVCDEDIPIIRALVASGMSQREVGNQFDVSNQTISRIVSGKRWRNVR